MSVRFELYKIAPETYDSEEYTINRMTTEAFDSININLSSPVSPMPLPENVSEENMLVKMEGNSKQVRFAFKFSDELVTLASEDEIAESDLVGREDVIDVIKKADGNTYTYSPDNTHSGISKISQFLKNFENKSITDTFVVRLFDTDTSKEVIKYGGSLISVDCTADATSPVVWSVNIDFLVGNVISIYDADTPDEPNNFKFEAKSGSGNSTTIRFGFAAPDRSGGTSITKYVLKGFARNDGDKQLVKEITSPSSSDGTSSDYDITVANSDVEDSVGASQNFTAGTRWVFYMYAVNTGGRGINTDEVVVVIP